jgi:hypothetical protein
MNFGDTLVVSELAILAPDTTAAVLDAVALQDSLTLRVTFNDYVVPSNLGTVEASLTREGANAPEVQEIVGFSVWRARQQNPEDPPPAEALRPERDVVLILSRPLLPEITYVVEIQGVVNVNGVPGGGGDGEVTGPAAPPPLPVSPDSILGDTLPAAPPAGDPPPGGAPPTGDPLPADPTPNLAGTRDPSAG